ncbi:MULTISPECIES: hypothetical protein [Bacillus cereus group]|uniref:Uncharacterized protein n=1 Tax=Bacillus mycoides TaxID=1405 RepID=A0ABX6Z9U4_BACMY|nr:MULTISPECIES: hypothetical protein [Bacillus cereus group]EJS11203.1 hypothetical protein IKO_00011 [Bacillus cereus VDM034]AJH17899.1 putative membrane protein [Bacillus mycoides]EEL96129.1 hypothetical protein bmyco0001_54900 [Bacillus mycoides DSM 2048]MDR4240282.1 hypothetical protein [Bacillus mycoides]MED1426506.1 hypothetical protein [Bacillus mycoides]
MFDGISIEIISKFSPVIVAIMGIITGVFMYTSNQFIYIMTTNSLDKQFRDRSNQAKLQFWFYIIGIFFVTIFYLLYTAIIYQNLYGYSHRISFLWNIIVWFISFSCFIVVFYMQKKFNKFINKRWHVKFFLLHCTSIMLVFFFATCKHLEKQNYADYIVQGGALAFLLSFFYFCLLRAQIIAINRQVDYDIQLLTDDTFRKIKNLKYEYSMDEKRMVFSTVEESKEKVKYVCDFSSKVYMKCTKIIKKDITAVQSPLSNNTDIKIVNNIEHTKDI